MGDTQVPVISSEQRKTIDDTFAEFLGAMNSSEKKRRAEFEAEKRFGFKRWAGTIQDLYQQFKIIKKVFEQIQDATDTWTSGHYDTLSGRTEKRSDYFYGVDCFWGYQFHITLLEWDKINSEERKKILHGEYREVQRGTKKSISIDFAGSWESVYYKRRLKEKPKTQEELLQDALNMVAGRGIGGPDLPKGLGEEPKMFLPPFYALHHDIVDSDRVIKYITAHPELVSREKKHMEDNFNITHSYGEKNWIHCIRKNDYDLTDFFNFSFDDYLNRLDQYVVHLCVESGRDKKAELAIDLEKFLTFDIEPLMKALFIKVNLGEYQDLQKCLTCKPQ